LAVRLYLREIVDRQDILSGKIFDFSIQLLVLLSLAAFTLSTMPHLSEQTYMTFAKIERICLLIFVFEYTLRVFVTRYPLRYIFSFYGLIDLIAVLPFLITAGSDTLFMRALRLLRVFRVFKLLQFNPVLKRAGLALKLAKAELIVFTALAIVIMYLAAVGIYYFESVAQPEKFSSIPHSFWWAVITLTTVGYGDMYPITAGGKIFTFVILLVGLGSVAVPAGIISSALTEARRIESSEEKDSLEKD